MGQDGQAHCASWNAFRVMSQAINNFSTVAIYGSNHPQGVQCNGAPATRSDGDCGDVMCGDGDHNMLIVQ